MLYQKLSKALCGLLFAAVLFTSCKKEDPDDVPSGLAPEFSFYVLQDGTKLLKFSSNKLGAPTSSVALNGLESGEKMLEIDFRPATGQLYGLGSSSRLYIINPVTGAIRAVNPMRFSPSIDGMMVGFDFNPMADRVRIITTSGQNLRLNPETGEVVNVDPVINGAPGAAISGAAYSVNVAGSSASVLFNIDVPNRRLYRQNAPNAGTLTLVGSLGVEVTGDAGFDILPDTSIGIAVFNDNQKKSNLYVINLATGSATKIGSLAGFSDLHSIAVPTNPVAYAVPPGNNLFIFNPTNPQMNSRTITGLAQGEIALGIDFRPLNGQLYMLTSLSKLYTVNAATGAATMVGNGPFTPLLSGTSFGFDFNPTVDRIRVVSNTGQNLRLNPETGAVAAVDGNISIPAATLSGAAYTNNFSGALTTTLYDIDAASDKLYKQDPPNNGTLVEVGNLGVNIDQNAGFDIGGTSGKAYAIFTVNGAFRLYTINLETGAATFVAPFFVPVTGLAVGLGF